MPTGYTAKLYDGEQDFEGFALTAARAFGALIEMRDTDLDAAIPDEFTPSPYHSDRLAEAHRRLEEARELTVADCTAMAEADYERWQTETKASAAETAARRARYEAMRERALAWHPPTDEHTGLRDFMVQQLEESIDFDCTTYKSTPPTLNGREWRDRAIAKAVRDIDYHTKELEADRKRAAERTAWVRALRESFRSALEPPR